MGQGRGRVHRQKRFGDLPAKNFHDGRRRPCEGREAMVHARTATVRLTAVVPRRYRSGLVSGLGVMVFISPRSSRCSSMAGRHGLGCCRCRGDVTGGVAHVLHVHGRASDARTVGEQGNDQEQPHQERAERHAP